MSDAHRGTVHNPTPLIFSSQFGRLGGELQERQLKAENLEVEDGANHGGSGIISLRRRQRSHRGCHHITAYGARRTENAPDAINSLSGAPHGNGKTR